MAKVFGVLQVELLPGVRDEDFVKFWREEYGPVGQRVGWKSYVLKADRGERAGQYAVIWEIPSVESRDRIAPTLGQISNEGQQLLGPEFAVLGRKLSTFVSAMPASDHVVQGD